MCTVLLRLSPDGPWPVLLGAIRDEFVERTWDPPARHWPEPWADLVGGRDHVAGGTWLAVDPGRRTVAALLNGAPLDPPADGLPRPTRGDLALRVLAGAGLPDDLSRYDRFHLLRAGLDGGELLDLGRRGADPRRAHGGRPPHRERRARHGRRPAGAPLRAPSSPPRHRSRPPGTRCSPATTSTRGTCAPSCVRKVIDDRTYGTTSGALIALRPDEVRYDFTATPADPSSWRSVRPGTTARVPPSP